MRLLIVVLFGVVVMMVHLALVKLLSWAGVRAVVMAGERWLMLGDCAALLGRGGGGVAGRVVVVLLVRMNILFVSYNL